MFQISSTFNDLLYSDRYWLIRHVLFWMIMYTDEVLAFAGLVEKEFNLKFFSLQIASDLLLVYLNLYLFIPKLLSRRKVGIYFLSTAFTVMLALVSNYLIIIYFIPENQDIIIALFRSFLLTMGILGTAISIKIIKNTLTNQQKMRALEKLNYDTEVNYLKMQVNPHFLFNTLNNIYVQSKKYPSSVPDTILKLADLMRYQIYNGSKTTVTLAQEMKFITDYLILEKIRKDNLKVVTKFEIDNPDLEVSPLLFIPLVENAIKHSYTDGIGVCNIEVYCHTRKGEIVFDITNTIGSRKKKPAGIGLKNLKRRLEILFPERHIIDIEQTETAYIASLRINTND